jgi:hypothetical protein
MARKNRLSLVLENPNIPADVKIPREEDVERMRKVIEADSLLVPGKLVCAAAGHCAVGALIFATGISNTRIARESSSPVEFSRTIAQRLYDWYRLDMDVATFITTLNDIPALKGMGQTKPYGQYAQHLPDALDAELAEAYERSEISLAHVYAPADEEIEARRTVVLDGINFATTAQRELGVESGWMQFGYDEFRLTNGHYDRITGAYVRTPRVDLTERLADYEPALPQPA